MNIVDFENDIKEKMEIQEKFTHTIINGILEAYGKFDVDMSYDGDGLKSLIKDNIIYKNIKISEKFGDVKIQDNSIFLTLKYNFEDTEITSDEEQKRLRKEKFGW